MGIDGIVPQLEHNKWTIYSIHYHSVALKKKVHLLYSDWRTAPTVPVVLYLSFVLSLGPVLLFHQNIYVGLSLVMNLF